MFAISFSATFEESSLVLSESFVANVSPTCVCRASAGVGVSPRGRWRGLGLYGIFRKHVPRILVVSTSAYSEYNQPSRSCKIIEQFFC